MDKLVRKSEVPLANKAAENIVYCVETEGERRNRVDAEIRG